MTSPVDGPVLALDSSTPGGSVAVGVDGRVAAEVSLDPGRGASSLLLPAVDRAVREAGLAPGDLAAVVAAGGPGSFTGLRIAAATAKAVVRALEVPRPGSSHSISTRSRGAGSSSHPSSHTSSGCSRR